MKWAIIVFSASLAIMLALPFNADAKVKKHTRHSTGVVSSSDRLPPMEGEYHGASSHLFMDGQAILTCSRHGVFQSNDDPPERKGESVDIDYMATFEGELTLSPPLVDRPTVYPIEEEIRMVERVTLIGRKRGERNFDIELISLDFEGSSFPDSVLVRESTQQRTRGRTNIERLPRRKFQINTTYNVWMELSLDRGQTWNHQDIPVKMSLMQRR
jgi:hypothetical protein